MEGGTGSSSEVDRRVQTGARAQYPPFLRILTLAQYLELLLAQYPPFLRIV